MRVKILFAPPLVHRRRLPVVMVRLKMSETLTEATTYIEQGHVRVGPHAVTDAAVSAFFSQSSNVGTEPDIGMPLCRLSSTTIDS